MIPFLPIAFIGWLCVEIYTNIDDWTREGIWLISNKMLCNCDEVKNGTIKNERYKSLCSSSAYNWLKSALNQKHQNE